MLLKKTRLELGGIKFDINPRSKIINVSLGVYKTKINRDDLWQMIFAISDPVQQESMIPTIERPMMQFKRVHNVKMKNDMKAGEMLEVTCKVDVPITVVDALLEQAIKERDEKVLKEAGMVASCLKSDDAQSSVVC